MSRSFPISLNADGSFSVDTGGSTIRVEFSLRGLTVLALILREPEGTIGTKGAPVQHDVDKMIQKAVAERQIEVAKLIEELGL